MQLKGQTDNSLVLNSFGQVEPEGDSCAQWLFPTDKGNQLEAISVSFEASIVGMTLQTSDGTSTTLGGEATSNSRVALTLPHQYVIGFFALQNFDNQVESLSLILFDCITGPDGNLIRWQDLPPDETEEEVV